MWKPAGGDHWKAQKEAEDAVFLGDWRRIITTSPALWQHFYCAFLFIRSSLLGSCHLFDRNADNTAFRWWVFQKPAGEIAELQALFSGTTLYACLKLAVCLWSAQRWLLFVWKKWDNSSEVIFFLILTGENIFIISRCKFSFKSDFFFHSVTSAGKWPYSFFASLELIAGHSKIKFMLNIFHDLKKKFSNFTYKHKCSGRVGFQKASSARVCLILEAVKSRYKKWFREFLICFLKGFGIFNY